MNNCENCIHESVCQKWFKELESAEECYSGFIEVSIYTRYTINGDGCEDYQKA